MLSRFLSSLKGKLQENLGWAGPGIKTVKVFPQPFEVLRQEIGATAEHTRDLLATFTGRPRTQKATNFHGEATVQIGPLVLAQNTCYDGIRSSWISGPLKFGQLRLSIQFQHSDFFPACSHAPSKERSTAKTCISEQTH